VGPRVSLDALRREKSYTVMNRSQAVKPVAHIFYCFLANRFSTPLLLLDVRDREGRVIEKLLCLLHFITIAEALTELVTCDV
jgi:hypothetical protein